MRKKIIIILFIAVVILIIIGYWYYQQQVFSKSILRLEVLGPDTVQMGEEFTYTVRYKNNSNFTLEEPRLTFEYPEYAVGENGKTIINQTLKDIYPGDEQFVQFKARLLGKENDIKTAKATLSYKPKNLSSRFESNTTFTSKIGAVPITLDFDLPSKIESNKEIQFSINYYSNIDYSFSDLKIGVQYPEKFEFSSATPKPLADTEWQIPNLAKAQGGRITINGKTSEDVGKTVTFSAQFGIWQEGNFVVLKETTKDVEIIQPLLYISQQINGSSNYIPSPGEKLHYEIYFKNIGSTAFENLYLIDRLDSNIFDLSTINVTSGQANVNDNMIVWDWRQIPALRQLDVQEEDKVTFDVTLKCCWDPTLTEANNTKAKNKVDISQTSQEFENKVNSKLVMLQRVLYVDNLFGNTGSNPPIFGQPTTYTVFWQVKNFYNNVKNVKVRATLPSNVSLTGKISPDSAVSQFSFDSSSRQIVWNVATDMAAGTGVLTPPPTIMFQVSLSPSFSGISTIINKATATAEDQWTIRTISGEASAVDTTLPDQNNPTNDEQE